MKVYCSKCNKELHDTGTTLFCKTEDCILTIPTLLPAIIARAQAGMIYLKDKNIFSRLRTMFTSF